MAGIEGAYWRQIMALVLHGCPTTTILTVFLALRSSASPCSRNVLALAWRRSRSVCLLARARARASKGPRPAARRQRRGERTACVRMIGPGAHTDAPGLARDRAEHEDDVCVVEADVDEVRREDACGSARGAASTPAWACQPSMRTRPCAPHDGTVRQRRRTDRAAAATPCLPARAPRLRRPGTCTYAATRTYAGQPRRRQQRGAARRTHRAGRPWRTAHRAAASRSSGVGVRAYACVQLRWMSARAGRRRVRGARGRAWCGPKTSPRRSAP